MIHQFVLFSYGGLIVVGYVLFSYRGLVVTGYDLITGSLLYERWTERKSSIGGLDILKFDKNSTDLQSFILQIGSLELYLGG